MIIMKLLSFLVWKNKKKKKNKILKLEKLIKYKSFFIIFKAARDCSPFSNMLPLPLPLLIAFHSFFFLSYFLFSYELPPPTTI